LQQLLIQNIDSCSDAVGLSILVEYTVTSYFWKILQPFT
jgi:hypothetical protein